MANKYVTKTEHEETTRRFDYLFWGIIGILCLTVITMVIMVAGMVIQAWQTRPIPEYYGNQKQIIDKLDNIESKIQPIK